MRNCKGIKILLAICAFGHSSEYFLPQRDVFCILRLSCMSFLSSLLLLSWSPALWQGSTVLGFIHIQFLQQELLPSWASAVLGLCLAAAELRLFQPG